MKTENRFIKHYEKGYMPWSHDDADFNLVDMISQFNIKPCKALEVGCGTGTDAIWLAGKGFEVTAVDVSPIAIELAMEKAKQSGADCHFRALNFLKDEIGSAPFQFAFDRGYFHSFKTGNRRKTIAKKIAENLSEGGLWLSLIGSADSPARETGPPMRSAKNIVYAVEPYFEILLLKASVFGNNQENPPKNWVCLMKKRGKK